MFAIFAIFILIMSSAYCSNITLYNDGHSGFALVSDKVKVELVKGENDYQLKNVTDQIIVNSLIIKNDDGVELLVQDYKPDRSNNNFLMKKSLEKRISLSLKTGEIIAGKLMFFNNDSITIEEEAKKNISIIARNQISAIELPELNLDYESLKPSLVWKLDSPKKQDTEIRYSYLTKGMNWKACYNAVWHEDISILQLNSEVVISNNTQKSFPLSNLKLLAGDVEINDIVHEDAIYNEFQAMKAAPDMARGFNREKISDFHLYSLKQKLSLPAYQSRQVQLYPSAEISAKKIFRYETNNQHLNGVIVFSNSKKNGLGEPLPGGVLRLYTPDSDKNNQFIADINLANYAENEEIELVMGKAFDFVAETLELNHNYDNRNRLIDIDYQVQIDNHSNKDALVKVRHYIGNLSKIYNADFEYEIIDNNRIEFIIKIKADSAKKVHWSQKR